MVLAAPATAAATAVAVATLLTVAPPTQPAVATTVQSPPVAQPAVQQTPVLEAAQAAAKSLAAPPNTITIIAWKIITGPTLSYVHLLDLIRQTSRSLSESYKARAAHARAHMC